MPERQPYDGIVRRLEPIRRDVAGIAKWDHEFAQFQRVAEGSPDSRVGLQTRKVIVDHASRPLGGASVFAG